MSKKKKSSKANAKGKNGAKQAKGRQASNAKKTSKRKAPQARGSRFQQTKVNLTGFIAPKMIGNLLDNASFSALKLAADGQANLKNLLTNDTNERIPNVNRQYVTKNYKKNCKKDAIQAFRVIRKGNKKAKKNQHLLKKALNDLTKNLAMQPELIGPPFAPNVKEVLKECSKCYYGRSMLYSFRGRDRTAFRLNANMFLKKMAPYEGEYKNKEKHVSQIGILLVNSYLDSVKHFESRKPKNYEKHIKQQCNKAVMAIATEAFALQGQTKIDKWFTLYAKIKKVEMNHGITWNINQVTNRNRVDGNQPRIKPKISLFRYVQLQSNILRARNDIKKNRCIISEPVIAAKWANKLGACAECNKQIKSNWSTPCSFCTQAVFCSKLCARVSMINRRHAPNVCSNFGFRLGASATLVHRLVELCGGPNELLSLLTLSHTRNQFPTTDECVHQNLQIPANIQTVALLSSGYSDVLNSINLTSELANLVPETIHLAEVFKFEFSQSFPQDEVIFGKFIFQMLRFVSGSPIASAKIGRPGAKERPAINNRPKLGKRRPKSFGFALGPLDSLFSFSCDPNIRRQLNLRSGTIEYVAVKNIRQGEPISLGWQARKQEPGVPMRALPHDQAMTSRFMKARMEDCLFCLTRGQFGTPLQP